jgi:hypothetical protein
MGQNFDSIITIVIAVVMVASMWRIFTKAGKPGWAAIIPYYNLYVLIQISKRPVWLVILFIPTITIGLLSAVLNPLTLLVFMLQYPLLMVAKPVFDIAALVAYIFVANGLAKAFGKGTLDTFGFVVLAPIWYPMYAFGSETYKGNEVQTAPLSTTSDTPANDQFKPL